MPNPLPLPMMFVQRLVMLASSPALRVAGVNAVSVVWTATASAAAPAWRVVPHAANPFTIGCAESPASAALFEQLVPVPPVPPAPVATSLITTEFGTTPVNVLSVRSLSLPG